MSFPTDSLRLPSELNSAKVHGWTIFKQKFQHNDSETRDDALKAKDSMLTDYKNDLMVTHRPYQVKEAADQVAVFSHVCDLKSNSWLHADRTYETMATTCHHPAQWADHHRASLFLVRWIFFGLERRANQSSDEGFTSCCHICPSLPFMDLLDTGEQVQFCFRCSLCLAECASTARWYMVVHPNSFIFHTNSKAVSLNLCRHM